MFQKIKSNQYVREYLWDDIKGLIIVTLIGIIGGGAITFLIYRPFLVG